MEARLQVENSLFDVAENGSKESIPDSVGQEAFKHGNKRAKAVKPKGPTTTDLKQLVERQGYQCALSGVPLGPESAELDHIIPLNNGGDHILSNVQIVDVRINRMKGTMCEEEFIELCEKVAAFAGKNRQNTNEKDDI